MSPPGVTTRLTRLPGRGWSHDAETGALPSGTFVQVGGDRTCLVALLFEVSTQAKASQAWQLAVLKPVAAFEQSGPIGGGL